MIGPQSSAELLTELAETRRRLTEAEELIRAIREGEVDSLLISTPQGDEVYPLAHTLRQELEFLQTLLDTLPNPVFYRNPQGFYLGCNNAYAEITGRSKDEIIGKSLSEVLLPESAAISTKKDEELLAQGSIQEYEATVMFPGGKRHPLIVHKAIFYQPDGSIGGVIGVITDITERQEAEAALREKSVEIELLYEISAALAVSINPEEMFSKLLDNLAGRKIFNLMTMRALFVVSDGFLRLVPHPQVSQEFIEMHRDLKVGECLCGLAAQQGEIVICHDCADDERAIMRCHDGVCYGHVFLPVKNMQEVKGVLVFTCSEQFQMDMDKEKILRAIGGLIGVALDNAALYEKSRLLSLSDPLTGLANRRFLDMMLGRSLARTKRYGDPLSVVMVDIDHFKKFNDTYGHVEGDRLLCQVAGLLAREIRQTDLVVRYGGEEFLIMLPDANLDDGAAKAEKIRQMIADATRVTISLGVASYQDGIKDKEDLINQADKALYAAKEAGRNQVKRMDEDNGNQITREQQTRVNQLNALSE